jgi:hypothetical protein
MTFLEICQSVRRESGISGNGPLSVANNIGELDRIVNWVKQAYQDIQDIKTDWQFLRGDFNFICTASLGNYPKSTVADLANWKNDSLRVYLNTTDDEQYLEPVEWYLFRDTRLYGPSRTVTGRPIEFSIKPDKSIVVWPTPDTNYSIDGEYYKKAHVMVSDSDEPIFSRFHMAIVWNAVMRYASYVESPTLFAKAQMEYNRIINKIDNDESAPICVGNTLA